MVTGRGRRGKTSVGCLVSLLLFVAGLYYGVNIGELYFRYYRLVDEMKTQARLAAALDNGTIRRRLQATVAEIGLPDSAGSKLIIRRTAQPRQIRIETVYSERVELPLFNHTFVFRPRAT
ncbi:MAG: hypothetical protein ACREF4_11590, partial [Gammaproteobacteria bacterium]